jgi:hypothetical protein
MNWLVLNGRSKLNTTTKDKPHTGYQNRKHLPYRGDALHWDLFRLRDAWRESRRQHDRFSIFKYLSAVFDLVMVWKKENQAIGRATRALRLKHRAYGNTIEPFAAIINCTTSRKVVDVKARSKWAHALMFAEKYKSPDESLEEFIRRHGGINSCTVKFSRLGRSKPRPR